MTDDPYRRVLRALRDRGLKVTESGQSKAHVQCPVHDDHNASATVSRGDRQPVLFSCQARKGCTYDDAMAVLGLDKADIAERAERPVWTPYGDAVAVYPYRDEAGTLLYEVCRTVDKQFPVRVPDPAKRSGWRWKLGDTRRVLYRLPEVVAAVAAGRPVFVCEGEKDVATLVGLGLDATCNPGGAGGGWRPEYSGYLRDANVMVIADADANGRKHARAVCDALTGVAAMVEIAEPAEGCKDVTDHVVKLGGLDGLRYEGGAAETPAPQPGKADGWDVPLPLGWQTKLPAFPLDALPPVLARFVRGLALEVQTPADLPGSVVLGILAACVGGRVAVVVRRGWREPTNLFVVPVMPPGSRKSAVISVCRAPLTEAEVALAEHVGQLIRDRRTEREIREQLAEAAKRAAAKDGDPVKIMEAQEAVRAAEEVVVPAYPRLTASDATPEALITLLAKQSGRIAAISAEAGIFTSLTGRYSRTPNLDPILMAHAGDAILVDRRGREPERVDAPALTLIASIQPFALRELVERPDFGGRGVLARILWALPIDNTGHRDVEPPEMPERDREAYRRLVYDLALKMAERDAPVLVPLSEAARKVHLEYHRTVERRLRRGGELGADLVREWGSKLAGAVARIAGCLHAAAAPVTDPISEATMRSAVELGDYYEAHAIAALAPSGDDKATSDARLLLGWVVDKGITRLKLRDLQRTGPKSLRKAADAQPVLDDLAGKGWIREHQNGGWEIHPHAARLLKEGDTGDMGDRFGVSAGQNVSQPVAQPVAQPGDMGDSAPAGHPSVALVAPTGDNLGDTLSQQLSSGNAESVAHVARVAPIDWPEGESTCPDCRWPLDSRAHFQNCEGAAS